MQLLEDIFELFCDLCVNDNEIGPYIKVSLPGFSFQVTLKYKNNVKHGPLQDYDMYFFIEEGIQAILVWMYLLIYTKYSYICT